MEKETKICPFCGGKVIYTSMDRNIKQPELVMCVGDCMFDMSNEDYQNPDKNRKYFDNLYPKPLQ